LVAVEDRAGKRELRKNSQQEEQGGDHGSALRAVSDHVIGKESADRR
jgi:hypothetical protein